MNTKEIFPNEVYSSKQILLAEILAVFIYSIIYQLCQQQLYIELGYLISLVTLRGITKSYFNPIISITQLINGDLKSLNLCLQIIGQMIGAGVAQIFAYIIQKDVILEPHYEVSLFHIYMGQILNNTFFIVITLLEQNKETQIAKTDLENYYIIAIAYYIFNQGTYGIGTCLNFPLRIYLQLTDQDDHVKYFGTFILCGLISAFTGFGIYKLIAIYLHEVNFEKNNTEENQPLKNK